MLLEVDSGWQHRTRVDLAARVSLLQQSTTDSKVKDLLQANKLIRAATAGAHHHLRMVPIDWNSLQIGVFFTMLLVLMEAHKEASCCSSLMTTWY